MIKVYAVNVSEIDVSDSKILKRMSQKRLEKINRLKPLNAKKQSVGAELALAFAIEREAGLCGPVEWETDKNGKLFIPNTDVFVNLAHSGSYAVCAVSDSEVGVDAELVKTPDLGIAKRFFTEEEYAFIKSSDSPQNAFYDIWVKKESFVKAVGKGLAIPLSSFSVLGADIKYEGKIYRFKRFSLKDKAYKLCVCFVV